MAPRCSVCLPTTLWLMPHFLLGVSGHWRAGVVGACIVGGCTIDGESLGVLALCNGTSVFSVILTPLTYVTAVCPDPLCGCNCVPTWAGTGWAATGAWTAAWGRAVVFWPQPGETREGGRHLALWTWTPSLVHMSACLCALGPGATHLPFQLASPLPWLVSCLLSGLWA